jgi:predicted small secreted protein
MRSLIVIVLALALTSCGTIKQIGRTIQDVAQALCLVAASEQPKDALGGMSAEDWCSIEENLRPFLDAALSAKQEAEGKAGFSRSEE